MAILRWGKWWHIHVYRRMMDDQLNRKPRLVEKLFAAWYQFSSNDRNDLDLMMDSCPFVSEFPKFPKSVMPQPGKSLQHAGTSWLLVKSWDGKVSRTSPMWPSRRTVGHRYRVMSSTDIYGKATSSSSKWVEVYEDSELARNGRTCFAWLCLLDLLQRSTRVRMLGTEVKFNRKLSGSSSTPTSPASRHVNTMF